jgi:hypothetical protein
MPYYMNPGMLQRQQAQWRAFPDELKARLHVIVVDDGSPTGRASTVVEPSGVASFRLFRTLVDVRWNWLFCRNLGVDQASTDWLLMTDIDHLLPVETLRRIVAGPLDPTYVYRFKRVDAPDLTDYKPHPNTWLMTKAFFNRIGGYDERFSGYYGTDGEFRDRVEARARAVVLLPEVMIRVPREVIPDASTTTYGRKEEQDKWNVKRIRSDRDSSEDRRTKRLTFEWVHECTLLSEVAPCSAA